MFINDTQKNATIALANFATSGALGTAATTVDIASSFAITQTTAGISITLPTPTNALAGDILLVVNNAASTQSITIAGTPLSVGEHAQWLWNGAAWVGMDGGRNMGASTLVAAVAAGNSVVAHNMAMPAGAFSQVMMRAYDANGSEVIFKRNKAADTANAVGISSPVALTNITFDFVPMA